MHFISCVCTSARSSHNRAKVQAKHVPPIATMLDCYILSGGISFTVSEGMLSELGISDQCTAHTSV
eukprot:277890-Amphidinium_carterae.1